MASDKRETVAEVVAEMRSANGFSVPYAPRDSRAIWRTDVKEYADRLDSAWKRESESLLRELEGLSKEVGMLRTQLYSRLSPCGDAAAMRYALKRLRDASRDFYHQILNSQYSVILDKYTCEKQGFPAVLDMRDAIPAANAALAAPPRNCDRFATVKDAAIAFSKLRNNPHPCPDFTFSAWLMSVTEEGAEA